MKELLASSVLFTAIATSGFAAMTVAETWSPTGPVTLSSVGLIRVAKSLTVDCNLTGSVTLNGADASVTSLGLTAGVVICGLVGFTDLPYNLEPSGLNSVTLKNVNMFFLGDGRCIGDLTGTFDQATGQITFVRARIPNVQGVSDCIITGTVATTPAASYTIP